MLLESLRLCLTAAGAQDWLGQGLTIPQGLGHYPHPAAECWETQGTGQGQPGLGTPLGPIQSSL